MKSVTFRRVALLSILVAAACAEDEAQWSVRYAPDFQKTAQARVSVLGVFRDGRMNSEAWDELGGDLSSPFATGKCPVAYDKDLLSHNEDLANAIDDYARANGVTDGLLEKLTPAANGDDVIVFTVAGRPRSAGMDAGAAAQAPTSAPSAPMRGGGHGGSHGMAMAPMRLPDRSAFEVSASLYSTKTHKSEALVAMEYSGSNQADAFRRFTEKMKASFPGAACTGWHWSDAHIDPASIRDLKEDE